MALVKTIGLDHVVLRCADVEASLRFYVDKLGLEPNALSSGAGAKSCSHR